MPPKFGTSGLRGLVTELTQDLVAAHVAAFLRSCPIGTGLFVARDLRASSPRIADIVMQAASSAGVNVTDCSAVPTPALAMAAMHAGAAAVMVTGSHIPDDRNGLKFYTPMGEITKADETAIVAALGHAPVRANPTIARPTIATHSAAGAEYVARYHGAYGGSSLSGLRIGVYSHSAVGRDLLLAVLETLGARVVELGRSDHFIPVDTEAVDQPTRSLLRGWAASGQLDAIVSTDGDGDRPLMTDAAGTVIPGDILGQITAAALGADTVATPISSNTGVEMSGRFARTIRTKIGSPFVIAAMLQAKGRVVGYEPNGGFLLGFLAMGPVGPLAPLVTRDALLPIVAPLARARVAGGLAALLAAEPQRFTATDRLQNVETGRSQALVARLLADPAALAAFLADFGPVQPGSKPVLDQTDGLRITLNTGRIVHLRPSGNAPELRFYAEAESQGAADTLLACGLSSLADALL